MLMNKCSKHRGLFKPPLTPERFWDADILEVKKIFLKKSLKKNMFSRRIQTILG